MLPQDVLKLMHASPKPEFPLATPSTLTAYNGFLLGIPTRFGSMPAQFKVRNALALHAAAGTRGPTSEYNIIL